VFAAFSIAAVHYEGYFIANCIWIDVRGELRTKTTQKHYATVADGSIALPISFVDSCFSADAFRFNEWVKLNAIFIPIVNFSPNFDAHRDSRPLRM
jgi:hypothetical protein